MSLIDTHCHLSDPAFDGDREAVLERAWAAGLSAVVEVADTEENWAKARNLAEHPSGRVWWAVGFHPYVADRFEAATITRLKEALRHPRAVAVGEIGLDYFKHCAVPRPRQREVFESLARCGVEEGKPLILHCRESSPDSIEAWTDMLSILDRIFPSSQCRSLKVCHPGESRGPGPNADSVKPFQTLDTGFRRYDGLSERHCPNATAPVPGVAHCFQGTSEIGRRLVDMGFFLGIDAPVTYPKAESLRAVLRGLPLESLVLETDSPYLPPQARRGGRNEPSFLPAVGEAVARDRGVPTETVARATTSNAGRLYNFFSPGVPPFGKGG
jgi:TatD DNase family protein